MGGISLRKADFDPPVAWYWKRSTLLRKIFAHHGISLRHLPSPLTIQSRPLPPSKQYTRHVRMWTRKKGDGAAGHAALFNNNNNKDSYSSTSASLALAWRKKRELPVLPSRSCSIASLLRCPMTFSIWVSWCERDARPRSSIHLILLSRK